MTSSYALLVKRSIALCPNRIGEGHQPFIRAAIRRDDDRAGAVAFSEDLVEVTALGGVQGIQREVVEDEEVDGEQLADLALVRVIEPGVLQGLAH
jgi:hypothetical protein